MKIKQLPEDFVVEEVIEPNFSDTGSYSLYLVEKTSMDTLEAKRVLMRKYQIPYQDIGVAGLKDKHAKTSQYITITGRRGPKYDLREKNITVTFKGYVDQPLKSGDLLMNRFHITVRALKEGEVRRAQRHLEFVRQYGVPNYFDSQRFGSLKGTTDFLAKHLLFGDFETALRLFMTRRTGFERAIIRACRRDIQQHWGHFDILLKKCQPVARQLREECRVFDYLAKNPGDFIGAFRMLDKAIKELFVSAYQSYLWNECVKLFIRRHVQKNLHDVPYEAGTLTFYEALPPALLEQWRSLSIPLLSKKSQIPQPLQPIVEKVLDKEGITLQDLVIKKMTALFFKERMRSLLVFPRNMAVTEAVPDELTQRSFKMTFSFELDKGAYATVVLKRIFSF